MISINSIKTPNYKQNKPSANYQSRPNFEQKADVFQLSQKTVSFKGKDDDINLHISVKDVEDMFAKSYEEIASTDDMDKKIKLTDKCLKSFRVIVDGKEPDSYEKFEKESYHFVGDRIHEIINPFIELYGNIYRIMAREKKGEPEPISNNKYNELCKYTFDRSLNTIKRYEFFLEKGLDKNTMSPNEVFQLALDSAEEKTKSKNIKIKVIGEDIIKSYPNGINGDEGRVNNYTLYTMFSNLIQNSAKYSPEDSDIIVQFEKTRKNNQPYLVFSVKDDGIGIPKEEQEKVVEGKRALNAVISGIEGTGYGLQRVYKILKNMGGSFTIESPVNVENKEFPGTKISCAIRLDDE